MGVKDNLVDGRRTLMAEILLTRRCNITSPHCGGITGRFDEMDADGWKRAIDVLSELGATSVVVCGGEPLLRFRVLVELIRHCADVGMSNSVISNSTMLTEEMCEELVRAGLDSWTVPVDWTVSGEHVDGVANVRAVSGLWALEKFKKRGIRDLAIAITVSRENFERIPEFVTWSTERGYRSQMDVVHYDTWPARMARRVPRSLIEGLCFRPGDIDRIRAVATDLKRMAHKHKLSAPPAYFDYWREYGIVGDLGWRCEYPAWLSINSDGHMMVCDDRYGDEVPAWHIHDLPERWDEYLETWERDCARCSGCFWSRHLISEMMIQGL